MTKLNSEQIEAIKNDKRPLKIVAYDYGISRSYASRVRGSRAFPRYVEIMKRIKELEYRIKILEGKI